MPHALRALVGALTNYAYYTARPRWINPLHYARLWHTRRAWQALRADHGDVLAIVAAMTPSGSTGCNPTDYLMLYRWIRYKKPQWVLECGSGMSTGVIAHALRQNGSGHVVSMEESEDYARKVRELLPADLAPFATILYSPVVVHAYGDYQGVSYADVPDHPYEMVFIDGPVARRPGIGKCFNADVIRVAANGRPVVAFLDQRITTLRALRAVLPQARIRYSAASKLSTISIE